MKVQIWGRKEDLIQYLGSLLFIFIEIYFSGLFYFMLHIIGSSRIYCWNCTDHDLFSTHIEVEKNINKKIDWGEMQVRNSGNYFNDDSLFSRIPKLMGGINCQIEHHLFRLYLSSIKNNHLVKSTCEEFNIPYVCINDSKNYLTK